MARKQLNQYLVGFSTHHTPDKEYMKKFRESGWGVINPFSDEGIVTKFSAEHKDEIDLLQRQVLDMLQQAHRNPGRQHNNGSYLSNVAGAVLNLSRAYAEALTDAGLPENYEANFMAFSDLRAMEDILYRREIAPAVQEDDPVARRSGRTSTSHTSTTGREGR